MSDNDIEDDATSVAEFDFPLPLEKISHNLVERHSKICEILEIPEDNLELNFIFNTVSSLCDPFTQPEENEKYILSVDFVSDILIGLSYSHYINEHQSELPAEIESIKFDLSTQFFSLLRYIHKALNAQDELELRYINNQEDSYKENIKLWTPKSDFQEDDFNLKIVYSMACVLVFSIYKLFKPKEGEYNLALNPYLHYFLKLWKCHTNIILLGLEIDRRLEDNTQEDEEPEQTPEIVKQALKGSSSIRYVLAWVVNQNPSSLYDDQSDVMLHSDDRDITDETLLNFVHPLGRRKVNGGSLSIDMRLVVVALLIINVGISFAAGSFQDSDRSSRSEDEATRRLNQSTRILEIGDILIDLEYDDRFDEDIRYIFENEYPEDDADEDWQDEDDEGESNKNNKNETEAVVEAGAEKGKSLSKAIRSGDDTIQFDENGRDWRDLPRGENIKFANWYIEKLQEFDSLKVKDESDDFFSTANELIDTLEFLTFNSIEGDNESEKRIGQVVLNTIAKAVKDEQDSKSNSITPDLIYQFWSCPAKDEAVVMTQANNKLIVPILSITNFELLLQNNSKVARCMMDEMLMCKGYRRVLIWFLTNNINLSSLLIDYVFELSSGLRGNKVRQIPYMFTRQGSSLVITEIERSMLLHEFLTNCSSYLSATDGIEIDNDFKVVLAESIAKKYLSLLCLMLTRLIDLGIINLEFEDSIDDYSNEIRILLINWVGKLPEARDLFFRIQKNSSRTIEKKKNESIHSMEEVTALFKKYENLSTIEITEDLVNNRVHKETIEFFTNKIYSSLKTTVSGTISSESGKLISEVTSDFKFFFQHFNSICKVEYIADRLFKDFESVVTSGIFGTVEEVKDTATDVESEFSTNFLNGSGHFEESKSNDKSSKKKGKKKKKSKKK
ncbi:hypothetical protein DFJ63DRAFT_282025 [Scheffersomyces coipomensis]|uniref:uncharacterized protein n=1 Tax=Scheffersomyces coipomensis TaxID=1788519 RepID=UPI00315D20BA